MENKKYIFHYLNKIKFYYNAGGLIKFISIFIVILVIFSILSIAPSAHAALILNHPNYTGLNKGLVGFWSFDGKDIYGTTVIDRSGKGNNGTITASTAGQKLAQSTIGKIGQGLEFFGNVVPNRSYVNFSNSAPEFAITGSVSMSTWYYGKVGGATDQFFINKGDTTGDLGWKLGMSDGTFRVSVSTTGSDDIVRRSGTVPQSGIWYHLVGVYNAAAQTMDFYVNGVLDNGTLSGAVPSSIRDATNGFSIGSVNNCCATTWTAGIIDDVRIYNRALTADEIKRLYRIGGTVHVNSGDLGKNDTLTKGLVGHWTFDGTTISGTRANDVSGQGNHGTLTNGPVRIKGKLGQAINLDGTNDYISIANESAFDWERTQAFSFALWLKPDKSSVGSQIPIAKQVEGGLYQGWNFGINYGNGAANPHKMNLNITNNASSVQQLDVYTTNNTNLNDGRWHHYSVTYDGSSSPQGVRIYEDGVSLALTTKNNNLIDTILNDVPLELGDRNNGASTIGYFGDMDDVRVYNRVLTADEVKRLYRIGGTLHVNTGDLGKNDTLTKGLVGWWTFDGKDISGNVAYDRSGQGNNGTLTNGPVRTIGKIGQALEFDGVNDYIAIADNSSLELGTRGSMSAWVKPKQPFVASPNCAPVLHKDDDVWTNSDNFGRIYVIQQCSDQAFYLNYSSGPVTASAGTVTTAKDNLWVHLFSTYDGSNIRTYVNGVLENSAAFSATVRDSTARLFIGAGRIDNDGSDEFFRGLIDEVRIYNRALSLDEIKRLYNLGR